MQAIVANLSAVYSGRGDSYLPPYDRMVMVKADGSVCIHCEAGYKPLNYMMAPTVLKETFEEDERVWTITGKNETLIITFHKVYEEINLPLGNEEPGLIRDNTEAHLQEWLTSHLELFGDNVTLVSREYQTGAGPIDILAEGPSDELVAIEVKRVAPMNTVGQVLRYKDALEEKHPGKLVIPVIAAVEFKASTLTIAEKKGVRCVVVPLTWQETTKNTDPLEGTLFSVPEDNIDSSAIVI